MTQDHHPADHSAETGPWPMGWAIAAIAGCVTALMCLAVLGAGFPAALTISAVSFAVFGALLGSGGVQRTVSHGASDAAHDHHAGGHH